MLDLFLQAQWGELQEFLTRGEPALWLQLLAVNGSLVLFWLYSRFKDRPLRRATVAAVRCLFVIGNTFVLFQNDVIRMLRPVINHFI